MIRYSKTTDTGQTSAGCPSITVFNEGLVSAFIANDSSNKLLVMFSQDGDIWTNTLNPGNNKTSVPPAIISFNNKIYCAFKANDDTNNVYLISSIDGSNWSATSHPGNNSSSQGPALFVFNNMLYCAFVANDPTNKLYIISSADGEFWSETLNPGNNSTSAPASFSVFNNQLYCAFKANDSSHKLCLISSRDGINWTDPLQIGNNTTSDSPSIAVYQNTLYCAFKSNDPSNKLLFTTTIDGLAWTDVTQPGNNSTLSGPSLAASAGNELKCLFKSNDPAHKILQFNALEADWMQQNISIIGPKKLNEICISGSHDSGMSSCHNGTIGAGPCNIITQTLPILGQLLNGARYFDIRPTISGGLYYTGHYTNTGNDILNWQGANGQSIDSIIADINQFTSSHNELIILKLSHDLQTDKSYVNFSQNDWNNLLEKLQSIQHLYLNSTITNLTEQTINDFIGDNSPCVVIIVDPSDSQINLADYPTGFFPLSAFPLVDQYSSTNDIKSMVADQISKMQTNSNNYFLLSWTLTQSDTQATNCIADSIMPPVISWIIDAINPLDKISVIDLADNANAQLYKNKDLMAAVSANCFPKILYIDDISSETGLVEMVMGMNKL